MRRAFCLFCLLPALACLPPVVRAMPTRAAEPGPTSYTPLPQPHWRTFAPPGGRFTVLLPTAPEVRALDGDALHQYVCKAGDAGYVVQYSDRPPETVRILGSEKLLTLAGDAFLKRSHGRQVSRSRLMRSGCPGERVVALRPSGRRETFCTYLAGNRLYHLIVVCPAGDAAEADADKFLDSFTPIPSAPPNVSH